jgi:hypothetical protein
MSDERIEFEPAYGVVEITMSELRERLQDRSPDELFDSDEITEWVAANHDPGDVYSPRQLKAWGATTDPDHVFTADALIEWARQNSSPSEVFGRERVRGYVEGEFYPGEVFSHSELEQWASENGFVHESEIEGERVR